MRPFIKWAGGKEKEIQFFREHIPAEINNYIEHFLGGGAVFFYLSDREIQGRKYINDFSSDLMGIYRRVRDHDELFFDSLRNINANFELMTERCGACLDDFTTLVNNYINDLDIADQKNAFVNRIREENLMLEGSLTNYNEYFLTTFDNNVLFRLRSAKRIFLKTNDIAAIEYANILETVFKMSLYNTIRCLYNQHRTLGLPKSVWLAYLFFIREYCYSSMFRFNEFGEFNVPYGGISYNSKSFLRSIEYMESLEMRTCLSKRRVTMGNTDFADFLNRIDIHENDFIFIDPPYDSEFSEYDQNEFNNDDQIRLADTLANIHANIMVVIKNTDFIFNLYHERGFFIDVYNKRYDVNFRNRNEQATEHLLITNYEIGDNNG